MSNNNNHPLGEAPWFHVILSTGLGTGFIPGAPGTAGAFFALAIWYVVYLFTGATATLFWITLALVVVTTVVGAWTSKVMERYWGEGRARWLSTNSWEHGFRCSLQQPPNVGKRRF